MLEHKTASTVATETNTTKVTVIEDASRWKTLLNLLIQLPLAVKPQALKGFDINVVFKPTGENLLIAICNVEKCEGQAIPLPELETAKFLIAQEIDVDHTDCSGATALWHVAHHDINLTKFLLAKQVNSNVLGGTQRFGRDLYTPIFAAVLANRADILDLLIASKADVNRVGSQPSPLYRACQDAERLPLIQRLLLAGATDTPCTDRNETPLFLALNTQNFAAARLILTTPSAKANLNIKIKPDGYKTAPGYYEQPLLSAVFSANPEHRQNDQAVISLLMAHGYAINEANTQRIMRIPDSKIEPSLTPVTPTSKTQSIGDEKNKLNNYLPIYDRSSYQIIRERQKAQFLTPPFLRGCGPGAYDIHWVVLRESLSRLELLIKHKANVNAQTSSQMTPLSIACLFGWEAGVRYLLVKEASIKGTPRDGSTVLHLACLLPDQAKAKGVVSCLLEHNKRLKKKLDINALDQGGFTAVHIAAVEGHLEIIKMLHQHDAKLDVTNPSGITPIFMAAQEGHAGTVEFLLSQQVKADVRRTADGMSPIGWAFEQKQWRVVDLFLSAMDCPEFPKEKMRQLLLPSDYREAVNLTTTSIVVPTKVASTPAPEHKKKTSVVAYEFSPAREERGQSARSFLIAAGFTTAQIERLQAKTTEIDEFISGDEKVSAAPPTTWLEGQLTAAMPGVISIHSDTTPNCYLYLDKIALKAQSCTDEEIAGFAINTFCAAQNEHGLKALSPKLKVKIKINGKISEAEINYEIKKSGKARVLCIELPKSTGDGRSTLFIGAYYAPRGLHTTRDKNALSNAVLTIHLPPSLADYQTTITGAIKAGFFNRTPMVDVNKPDPVQHVLDYYGDFHA